MNVGQLKERLDEFPDDYTIFVEYKGNDSIEVGDLSGDEQEQALVIYVEDSSL